MPRLRPTPAGRGVTNVFVGGISPYLTIRGLWSDVLYSVDGMALTIVYGDPEASFDQALAKLQPLLASVMFD